MAVKNITTGEVREEEATQALADQGFVPVDTSSLSSSMLQDQNNESFETYQEQAPLNSSTMEIPDIQATEPEKQIMGLEDTMTELEKQTLGESAYRTEQENKQGMADLLKTQTDLSSQLKAIQNEASQIPLQLQKDSEGRGITSGGLAPLQSARLRDNAIQALSVNSLLEASKGNIATAQTLVDRAVAQKFDPIKEKIAVTQRNLERIINSPRTSIADKNRAKKQLELENEKTKVEAKNEENQKTIYNIGVESAASGMLNGAQLKAIQDAKTPEEALALAQKFGVYMADDVKKLLADGYTKIASPEQLSGLTEDDITRLPNGDIYKKPEKEEDEVIDSYVDQIRAGNIKISSVPADLRNDVVKALGDGAIGGGGGGKKSGGGSSSEGEMDDWEYGRSIIEANPDATREELKTALLQNLDLSATEINAILDEAKVTATKAETFSEPWLKEKIKQAKGNDFSNDEIAQYIIDNFDVNEIFKTAKEAGKAKWYTGKETDVKRYIKSLME